MTQSANRISSAYRWWLGLALGLVVLGAPIVAANAQSSPPTPLSGTPRVPKTVPLFGAAPSQNLAAAAADDKADTVTLLLGIGTSANETDESGRTGLINAARNNNVGIAQALLNHGAQLDLRDRLGKSALHWAADRGSLDVMRLLLAAKATVDVQDLQGMTPLMIAAAKGQQGTVRLLLQSHADPKKEDYTGRDAIDWASNNSIQQSLKVAASASR